MQAKSSLQGYISNSISLKLIVILFLILILQIPLSYVRDLVYERQSMQHQAQQTISQSWGGDQSVAAPFMIYRSISRTYREGSDGKYVYEDKQVNKAILSEEFLADIKVTTEMRYLGIYESIVFHSNVSLQGTIDLSVVETSWLKSSVGPLRLFIPIKEFRGLKKINKVMVNNQSREISKQQGYFQGLSGIFVDLDDYSEGLETLNYEVELYLAGSQRFDVLPLAGLSKISIQSNWASPSFIGDFLPVHRTIKETGFQSHWEVNELNHNLGRVLNASSNYRFPELGVKFHIPANIYQVNERTVKYSFLIVLLTFACFFLSELFFKIRLHPFQYLLVGVSLSVFYLILLSLSELLSFTLSYIVSVVAIVALVSGYCSVIFGKRSRGIYTGLLFAFLYAYIYVLVNAEQTSLLMGSVGIWVFIATVMYLTRKIDWYNLNPS